MRILTITLSMSLRVCDLRYTKMLLVVFPESRAVSPLRTASLTHSMGFWSAFPSVSFSFHPDNFIYIRCESLQSHAEQRGSLYGSSSAYGRSFLSSMRFPNNVVGYGLDHWRYKTTSACRTIPASAFRQP